MMVQIVAGVPLEMVHGSCRIATIYMAGILAGITDKFRICLKFKY